ncbi:MAG: hypothetical protein E7623_06065 [Ruminococcaceae bacterium]|nr:hypothetical protein [Oscillospiraceae bacterium]
MRLIKTFLLNATVVTVAALFMRAIDFSFNVYVSNEIGSIGMGLYSLIMSVYSFAVTFATSGINLAVTRIISEAIGSGDNKKIRKSVLCCILYSLFLGMCSGGVLYVFAEEIGKGILGDIRTVASLKLLAFSCVFLSVGSAFAGYFTAVRRVYKNAFVSVCEQLIRIGVTVASFRRLSDGDIEYACVSLCAGLVIAECISFIMILLFYYIDVKKSRYTYSKDKLPIKKLLGITVPVAVSSYIRSGLVTLEHVLIPSGLKKCGSTYEKALSDYGVLHGMVMPVIFFPQVLLSSFSSILIPELTVDQTKDEKRHIRYVIKRIVQITLLYSVFVSGILMFFGDSLGFAIYNNRDSGRYIRYMAPLIPIMYLDTAIDTMLKGLGEQFYSMCVNIVDAFISVILVYTLLPKYSLAGYIVTVYVCEILNLALSVTRLLQKTGVRLSVKKYLVMPLISIIGATYFSGLVLEKMNFSNMGTVFELVFTVLFTLGIYVLAVNITGTFDKEDRHWVKKILK